MHRSEQPLFAPSYLSTQLYCEQAINSKYILFHNQSDMKRHLTSNQSTA